MTVQLSPVRCRAVKRRTPRCSGRASRAAERERWTDQRTESRAGAGGFAIIERPMTTLVAVLTSLLLVTPAARAQEPPARPLVAFVGAESASTNQHFLDAFRQGLREYGYVDGQNLTLQARWAEGRSERFSELIGELLQLKARVILTSVRLQPWRPRRQ